MSSDLDALLARAERSFLSGDEMWNVAGYFEEASGERTVGWALFRGRTIVAIFHNEEKPVADRCAEALNADRVSDV